MHRFTFPRKDTCGGTYSERAGGIITSPDFPTPYTSDLNCTWRIVAPFGHYVSLHFLQVEIYNTDENCTNPQGRLQIRDKNATGIIFKETFIYTERYSTLGICITMFLKNIE